MNASRTALAAGLLLAGSAVATVAGAPAASAADVECRGAIGAVTVIGTVIVPDDATCTLTGTSVQGSVVVKSRATLDASGVVMTGSVQGESPMRVSFRDSRIGNGFTLTKSDERGALELLRTRVTGDVQVADNRGAVRLSGNTVGGSIQVDKNVAGVSITDNRITGGLQCQANWPAPVGGGNVAAQKQGQCVAL